MGWALGPAEAPSAINAGLGWREVARAGPPRSSLVPRPHGEHPSLGSWVSSAPGAPTGLGLGAQERQGTQAGVWELTTQIQFSCIWPPVEPRCAVTPSPTGR